MVLLEMLAVGADTAQWPVWSTTARLVVTDPDALAPARALVEAQLREVEQAASRFRPDSELSRLGEAQGAPQTVSPLLAELVAAALAAARLTDGDVDPTVGGALRELGYDRDYPALPTGAAPVRVRPRPAPGWQRITLRGLRLTVPRGVTLDLGATAKAWTADRCAALVARHCGCGALVALGGDIGLAGDAPADGWQILVGDRPEDTPVTVGLAAGGIASSSTASRTWLRGERTLHHLLDPATCQPVRPVWRLVTVAARSCLQANIASTAAHVRGHDAPAWLAGQGLPSRLVRPDGSVVLVAGWPDATPTRGPDGSAAHSPAPSPAAGCRAEAPHGGAR